MGIISEVKCARCDRKYSGFRSRCPYCGARRGTRGKHAAENDNSKGKLLIGIIFLVVLIAVVLVLVISSGNKHATPSQGPSASLSGDDDVTSVDGTSPSPSTSPKASEPPAASPSPSPSPTVESIGIYYLGEEKEDVTLSVGEVIDFDYEISPEGAVEEKNVKWASSNQDVFVVLQTGEVTALAASDGEELTVTAGGKTATCIIRVNG